MLLRKKVKIEFPKINLESNKIPDTIDEEEELRTMTEMLATDLMMCLDLDIFDDPLELVKLPVLKPKVIGVAFNGVLEQDMGLVKMPVGYETSPFYPPLEMVHPSFSFAYFAKDGRNLEMNRCGDLHVRELTERKKNAKLKYFEVTTIPRKHARLKGRLSNVIFDYFVTRVEPLHYVNRHYYEVYRKHWVKFRKKYRDKALMYIVPRLRVPQELVAGMIMSMDECLAGRRKMLYGIHLFDRIPKFFCFDDYKEAVVSFLSNDNLMGKIMITGKEEMNSFLEGELKASHILNYVVYEDTIRNVVLLFRPIYDFFISDDSGIKWGPEITMF